MTGPACQEGLRKFIGYSLAVIGLVTAIFVIGLIAYRDIQDGAWYAIAKEHFAAVIGLPFAGVAAFVLVRAFEHNNDEKVKFKALGDELSAASGAVILWVVVFLSITASIKILW
jgi:hypothetical protein